MADKPRPTKKAMKKGEDTMNKSTPKQPQPDENKKCKLKKRKKRATKFIIDSNGKRRKIFDWESTGVSTSELISKQAWKPKDDDSKEIENIKSKFNELSDERIQQILLGQDKDISSVQDHVYCIRYNGDKYISHLSLFIKFNVFRTLSVPLKGKILVALLIENKKKMIDNLLYIIDNISKTQTANIGYYSVPEIAKVIQLLDGPRLCRQYIKQLNKLENVPFRREFNYSTHKKRILTIKNKIHNLQKDGDGLHEGSLSGAKQRFFRKWVKSVDKNTLSFFLLNFPKNNWKYIFDLIHTHPEKDFPDDMKFFQKVIFNDEKKKDDTKLMDTGSMVYNAKQVNKDNLVELLTKYPYLSHCYSYIRTKLISGNNKRVNLPDKAKLILSERAPLRDLLWWYDEDNLGMEEVDKRICERLSESKDKIVFKDDGSNKSTYGKLMERLLKFLEQDRKFAPLLIPHIQQKLQTIPRIYDIFSDIKYI